jgi:small subunit ribosomal protein S24e
MELEINSKKNNPLFNRTEIRFTIIHKGEGTPNREIIRSELAEKLNAKKENIIINNINSSFGVQQSTGYAKVYSSPKKSEDLEKKYILKRNNIAGKQHKKKEEKKELDEKLKGEEKTIESKEEEKSTETKDNNKVENHIERVKQPNEEKE